MAKFMFQTGTLIRADWMQRIKSGLLAAVVLFFVILIEQSQPLNAASNDYTSSLYGSDYRLAQLDKVRVRVFAWRATKDEVFEWSALNGEYAVSSSGKISVPLIGEVTASGVTTAELGRAVGRKLTERIGLRESPEVSVEITQYRPFYIVGNVERPGEYAFRPQMTVLQALSIAGGPERTRDLRNVREIITTHGDMEILRLERSAFLAKKMRLLAEMSGAAAIDTSLIEDFELREPGMGTSVALENRILDARKMGYDAQIASYAQLVSYLVGELKSARSQLASRETDVSLVRQELQTVKELLSKKLTIETRRIGLERNLTQVDGERLRAESGVMRVQQDISRARVAMLDLQNKRTQDVTTELSDTETKLALVAGKLKTNERLLGESKGTIFASADGERATGPFYVIVRQRDGVLVEVSATENTSVEPGDTIKIDSLEQALRPMTTRMTPPMALQSAKPDFAAFK